MNFMSFSLDTIVKTLSGDAQFKKEVFIHAKNVFGEGLKIFSQKLSNLYKEIKKFDDNSEPSTKFKNEDFFSKSTGKIISDEFARTNESLQELNLETGKVLNGVFANQINLILRRPTKSQKRVLMRTV